MHFVLLGQAWEVAPAPVPLYCICLDAVNVPSLPDLTLDLAFPQVCRAGEIPLLALFLECCVLIAGTSVFALWCWNPCTFLPCVSKK